MLEYLAGDQVVALVHQYTRPDATLGGSGRPDPKKVVVEGKCYRLLRKKDRDSEDPVTGGS